MNHSFLRITLSNGISHYALGRAEIFLYVRASKDWRLNLRKTIDNALEFANTHFQRPYEDPFIGVGGKIEFLELDDEPAQKVENSCVFMR